MGVDFKDVYGVVEDGRGWFGKKKEKIKEAYYPVRQALGRSSFLASG